MSAYRFFGFEGVSSDVDGVGVVLSDVDGVGVVSVSSVDGVGVVPSDVDRVGVASVSSVDRVGVVPSDVDGVGVVPSDVDRVGVHCNKSASENEPRHLNSGHESVLVVSYAFAKFVTVEALAFLPRPMCESSQTDGRLLAAIPGSPSSFSCRCMAFAFGGTRRKAAVLSSCNQPQRWHQVRNTFLG